MHYQDIETKFRVEEAEKKLNLARNQREIEKHERKMDVQMQQMSLDDQKHPQKLLDELVQSESGSNSKNELAGFQGLKGFTGENKGSKDEQEAIDNVEYLFQHHSEIFNVTPPNAKAEDKQKPNMARYPLKPVETQ